MRKVHCDIFTQFDQHNQWPENDNSSQAATVKRALIFYIESDDHQTLYDKPTGNLLVEKLPVQS
jgi:hypothetical protein